jgi:tripartite-type tricarboxylate transporter receptor subunit TctC
MLGTSGHLGGELLKNRLDFTAVTVPYKGAAPATNDLVAGQVDFTVENVITVAPLVKAGRLRALAVTTRERSQILPDVPTLAEQGYPDIDVGAWLGVLVSARTPPAIVARLNTELNAVLDDPEVKQQLAQQGGITLGGTPADFDAFIKSEKDRWEKIIKAAGIKVE